MLADTSDALGQARNRGLTPFMAFQIQDQLNEKLNARGIIVEQALLRKLVLPVDLL